MTHSKLSNYKFPPALFDLAPPTGHLLLGLRRLSLMVSHSIIDASLSRCVAIPTRATTEGERWARGARCRLRLAHAAVAAEAADLERGWFSIVDAVCRNVMFCLG